MPRDPSGRRELTTIVDPPLPAGIIESAKAFARKSRAENTRRVYDERCKLFQDWCNANGRTSLPTSIETLIGYLSYLATNGRQVRPGSKADPGVSVSTIQITLAAIVRAHQLIDPTWSVHRDPRVTEVMKGIRRTRGVAPKSKKPIVAGSLVDLIESTPKDLVGLRDRAIITIGFSGAFRRSELVALDRDDIVEDGDRGIRIRIRKSKTDQERVGTTIGIPFGSTIACPVTRLFEWIDVARIEDGAIFRRVTRWGQIGDRLNARQVLRTVQNALARLGIETAEYGAHSLRAGLATSAAMAGKPTHRIMAQGRWSSSQTLDRYIRDIGLFDENAADGLT